MPYEQEKVNALLAESKNSNFERVVRNWALELLKRSSDALCPQWEKWDRAQAATSVFLRPDIEDVEAKAVKEPAKLLIPIAFAQLHTLTAFAVAQFCSRRRFYELDYLDPSKSFLREALETDLDYQMRKQRTQLFLYKFLMDVGKYGIGFGKVGWTEKHQRMRVARQVQMPPSPAEMMLGIQPPAQMMESVEDILTYQGNEVKNIPPYCFYPDPTVPLGRFQEGNFVGHEELKSLASLKEGEGSVYFGTEHIPTNASQAGVMPMGQGMRKHYWTRKIPSAGITQAVGFGGQMPTYITYYSEVIIRLVPKDFNKKLKDTGVDLGDGDKPELYLIGIANDEKVIRFEPLNYLHGQFPYFAAEWDPNDAAFASPGLVDNVGDMQALMTWFINSHVANVRKAVLDRFIVDPTRVHIDDIKQHSEVIRLKGTADITAAISQLQVADVTRAHMGDADSVYKMLQVLTGINDNALGQYSPGRRSASESRQVQQGASMRLKLFMNLAWEQALLPLGEQILSNTRQGRTEDVYNKIVGSLAQKAPYQMTILADPDVLAGGYEILPFDATLPSEKFAVAGKLEEIFGATLKMPPQLWQLLDVDPKALLDQVMTLYGITDFEQWSFQARLQKEQGMNPAQMLAQNGPQVATPEQLAAQGAMPAPPQVQNAFANAMTPRTSTLPKPDGSDNNAATTVFRS